MDGEINIMAGYPEKDKGYQMWVTDLQLIATNAPSGQKIITECLEIAGDAN
jgi:hypothetical protein